MCHCEEASGRRGNPFLSLPLGGEGGSRVSRKRETDEGLASPYGRGASGSQGGCGLPHQSADWFAMTCVIRFYSKKQNDTERYPMVYRIQTSRARIGRRPCRLAV